MLFDPSYRIIAIATAILKGMIPLLLALPFAGLAIHFYQEAQWLPSAPQPISLTDPVALAQLPPDREYLVTLEDSILDCPNLHTVGWTRSGQALQTDLLITNENRTVVMVAHIGGEHTCQEIAQTPVTGLLSRDLDRNAIQHTGTFGLEQFDFSAYSNATVYLELEYGDGRDSSQRAVIVFAVLAVVPLLLYPLVWWSNRRYGSSGWSVRYWRG